MGAKSVDSHQSDGDDDMITTEDTAINSENTTDIYQNEHSNLVIEEETRLHPDDTFNTTSDDIIYLNVGGQTITTLRSTLTAVPHSKLALMFVKEKQNKTKSKKDIRNYFFDYNPVQFEYLLNQLRTIKRLPEKPSYELTFTAPSVDVKFNFSDMLLDLGLNGKENETKNKNV